MHSRASDGSEAPYDIIWTCHRLGLDLCSVTDHDNIEAQAQAAAAARMLGQPYLTGIEISVIHTGELHILGYGMDVVDPHFVSVMNDLRRSRVERIHCILEALHAQGVPLTLDEVRHFAGGSTLGRVHVALALVDGGYAPSFTEAFDTYLNEGGLCYVKRRRLSAEEAIALITQAGGLAVLAHPKLVRTDNMEALLDRLCAAGLSGIEAFYPLHTDSDVDAFEEMARARRLLVTCGSDSHGRYRDAPIGKEKRTSPYLEKCAAFLAERAVVR